MSLVDVRVKEIRVTSYSRKTDIFKVKIFLDVNGKEEIIEREYKAGKAAPFVGILIEDIKTSFKRGKEGDFLDSYSLVRIYDQEKTEEKLDNFFRKINEKILGFKRYKSADGYLNMLYSIEGLGTKL